MPENEIFGEEKRKDSGETINEKKVRKVDVAEVLKELEEKERLEKEALERDTQVKNPEAPVEEVKRESILPPSEKDTGVMVRPKGLKDSTQVNPGDLEASLYAPRAQPLGPAEEVDLSKGNPSVAKIVFENSDLGIGIEAPVAEIWGIIAAEGLEEIQTSWEDMTPFVPVEPTTGTVKFKPDAETPLGCQRVEHRTGKTDTASVETLAKQQHTFSRGGGDLLTPEEALEEYGEKGLSVETLETAVESGLLKPHHFREQIVYRRIDIEASLGQKKDYVAYSIVERSGMLSEDESARKDAILRTLSPDTPEKIKEKLFEMFDPLNPNSIIDSDGFLILDKDPNTRRIRIALPNKKTGKLEPRYKADPSRASNIIVLGSISGEKLDLSKAYTDTKAFDELVEEEIKKVRGENEGLSEEDARKEGRRTALAIAMDSSKEIGIRKTSLTTSMKRDRADGVHEKMLEKERQDYLWGRHGLNPNDDSAFLGGKEYVVLKINIDGGANKEIRNFRLREKALARIAHKNKSRRLYTSKTVGDREVAFMKEYETAKVGNFKKKVGGLEGIIRVIGLGISNILEEVHEEWGTIHRDLKPLNIFLEENDSGNYIAILGDFELAKQTEEESSNLTMNRTLGTPNYMAPEQAKSLSSGIDKTADIYSLGKTLAGMYLGDDPYTGAEDAESVRLNVAAGVKPFSLTRLKYKPLMYEGLKWYQFSARRKRRRLVENFELVTARMSQFEKEERYQDCGQIREDLEDILEDKNPRHTTRYMEENDMNKNYLIEGAYETGRVLRSEESKQAVAETLKFYNGLLIGGGIIATGLVALACYVGYVIGKTDSTISNGKNHKQPTRIEQPLNK